MLSGSLHMRCSAPLPAALQRTCIHRAAPSGLASLRASRPQRVQHTAARQPLVTAAAGKAALEEGPVASATLRFKPGSAHKFRRVLDQIRGRTYEEALMILEYLPYRAVEHILPTLMSAAANAKENLNLSKLNLYVSECYADSGPALKRFTNGYKGRAYKILKPVSHVTIKVRERRAAKKTAA